MTKFVFLYTFFTTLISYALPPMLQIPDAVKQKYASLYEMQTQTLPDGSLSFHNGRLFERNGIRVLSLKGDRFEMAFQHGRLLAEEIRNGSIPKAAQMLGNSVKTTLPNIPVISEWIITKLYELVPDKMVNTMQSAYPDIFAGLQHDAWGLSEASGLSTEQVVYGMLAPESVMVLYGKLSQGGLLSRPNGNACSAFAVWNSKTKDGSMIIGRNTDFGLNGYYDKYPTAVYFQPTDGGQKYLALGSAGVHLSGILGYNESGIYLGVHLIPTKDVSADSLPMFIAGQEVIKRAKNFDEAVEILSSFRPGSGWIYLLASTKERKAASIEFSHNHMGIRNSSGDFHIQTNHYETPQLEPYNFFSNHAIYEDSHARMDRINEMINSTDIVSTQTSADILSDKWDPYHKTIRGVGNTVSVHTTMTSAIFDAGQNKLYMANGMAPVSQNEYIELPSPDLFNADTFSESGSQIISSKSYVTEHPAKARAEKKFIAAKIAYEIDMNTKEAEQLMLEALRADTSNPHYYMTLAVFQLKQNKTNDALSNLEKVTTMYDKHLANVAQYFIGRIHAMNVFSKKLALNHLRLAFELSNLETEKSLKAAAEKSIQSVTIAGYVTFNPSKVSYLMQEGDFLSY